MDPHRPSSDAAVAATTEAAAGPDETAARDAELVAAERAQAAADRQQRAARRMHQTVRDMVLSLLVVGVVVIVIAQPWRQTAAEQPVRVVPWAPVAQAFATTVDWPVLTPRDLPTTWVSTSARIEPTVDGLTNLHVGWITAGQQYAALEQSDTADVHYLPDKTGGGTPTGTAYTAAGRTWQRWQTPDDRTRSLVLVAPQRTGGNQVTYVVTGSATWAELEQLATSLR